MQRNREYSSELEDKLNDASLYGEFMSTYNYWISSEEQKSRAAHLQNLGKSNQK